MTDLRIIIRSLRVRLFSTTVTVLTVAIAVGLLLTLLILKDSGRSAFARGSGNAELLVSADNSPLVSVLNGVFYANPPRNPISMIKYESIRDSFPWKWTVPMQLGESYRGQPVVATTSDFFTEFEPVVGEPWAFSEGRRFAKPYELVVGSEAARLAGLKMGDKVPLTHGFGGSREGGHVHDNHLFEVVGILDATGASHDRAIFTDLRGSWVLHAEDRLERESGHDHGAHGHGHDHGDHDDHGHDHEHDDHAHDHDDDDLGHEHENDATAHQHEDHEHDHEHDDHAHDHDDDDHGHEHGHDHDHDLGHDHGLDHHGHHHPHLDIEDLTDEDRLITGILLAVPSRGGRSTSAILPQAFDMLRRDTSITVASPANQIDRLFTIVGNIDQVFVAMAIAVLISGIGILLALWNSMEQRRRQIAILQVLGCSRGRIFSLVITESVLIGVCGTLLGILTCWLGSTIAADQIQARLGVVIDPRLDPSTIIIVIAGTLVLATLSGLAPALRAYRTSVAENLRPIG